MSSTYEAAKTSAARKEAGQKITDARIQLEKLKCRVK